MEDERVSLQRRIHELESATSRGSAAPVPAVEETPPYVGLRALVMAHEDGKTS
jgi:hypothetical protein